MTDPWTGLTRMSVCLASRSEEYDHRFIHSFILTFPLSPVATLLSGFLKYFGFPSPDAEEEEKARRAKRREVTRRREALAKKAEAEGEGGADGGVGVSVSVSVSVEDEEGDGARSRGGQDKDPFTVLVVRHASFAPKTLPKRAPPVEHLTRAFPSLANYSIQRPDLKVARHWFLHIG